MHTMCINVFFFYKALLQEIAYAVHLGLPAIMVNLTKQPCTNLAALINGICFDSHVQQVSFLAFLEEVYIYLS